MLSMKGLAIILQNYLFFFSGGNVLLYIQCGRICHCILDNRRPVFQSGRRYTIVPMEERLYVFERRYSRRK